jgi:hypothetical protein
MDSANSSHGFDPLDLEILDRVYQAAWAHIEARDLYCGPKPDGSREAALRKAVFSLADRHPVDFDALCDKVMASLNGRPGS